MIIKSKKKLANNSVIKAFSLIFGYAFWLILAKNQIIEISHNIPLTFYLPEAKLNLTGPSNITVGLKASRFDLQKLDLKSMGAHIDTSNLTKPGVYPISITSEQIFVPNYLKLLYYTPVMINIEISESNFNEQT